MPNKQDLYQQQNQDFGYNDNQHITILYGFLDGQTVDTQKMGQYLYPTDKLKIKVTGMSVFELQKYDVLKLDVQCKQLNKMNTAITKNFKYSNDYDKYIPHLTIAYLKPGTGSKYIKNIKLFYAQPDQYIYNYKQKDIQIIPIKLK